MSNKLDQHRLEIKKGDPPERKKTVYHRKADSGTLSDIAQRIKPGEYVENLSPGSLGKLKKLIKERSLTVVTRGGQTEEHSTLYVVTKEWLAKHPRR